MADADLDLRIAEAAAAVHALRLQSEHLDQELSHRQFAANRTVDSNHPREEARVKQPHQFIVKNRWGRKRLAAGQSGSSVLAEELLPSLRGRVAAGEDPFGCSGERQIHVSKPLGTEASAAPAVQTLSGSDEEGRGIQDRPSIGLEHKTDGSRSRRPHLLDRHDHGYDHPEEVRHRAAIPRLPEKVAAQPFPSEAEACGPAADVASCPGTEAVAGPSLHDEFTEGIPQRSGTTHRLPAQVPAISPGAAGKTVLDASSARLVPKPIDIVPDSLEPSHGAEKLPRVVQAQAPGFPSDEAVSSMSRRERIASLEGWALRQADDELPGQMPEVRAPSADLGLPRRRRLTHEATQRRHHTPLATMQALPAEKPSRRECREAPVTCADLHAANNELASQAASRSVAGAAASGADDEQHALDDAAWEQRRLVRKQRLQQRCNAARTCSAKADADSFTPRAGVSVREPGRPLQVASQTAVGAAPASGSLSLEEVESVCQVGLRDPRWCAVCSSLAVGAHKLSASGLVRAVEKMASVACPTVEGQQTAEELASTAAFRDAAEALVGCMTSHLGSLSSGVVIESALRLLGRANISEQAHLDMLLAQLLVLLRRDRASFTSSLLCSLAGAIGLCHSLGLSAKRAASGPSSVANRRCTQTLADEIVKSLNETQGPEDLAKVGGPFLVAFMDDPQRRAVLRRASELDLGLGVRNDSTLAEMQDVERAVRQHSFAFVASLPDTVKDYLMKLKES